MSGRRLRRAPAVWVGVAGLIGALCVAVVGGREAATPRLLAALSRLGGRLDAQWSADQVAGTWLDQRAGKLVVATTAAHEKEVRARLAGFRDVRVRRVERSGKDLAWLNAKVGAERIKHGLHNVSWYVDVQHDTVDVKVGDGNADTRVRAFTDDMRLFGPGVTVKRVHGVMRKLSGSVGLWNGSGITTGGVQCSAGFGARNSEGKDFVITAGHCVDRVGLWYHQGLEIGGRGSYRNDSQGDWGVIHVISLSAVYPTNLINTYDGHPLKLTGSGMGGYVPGAPVCKSGERTGYTCGQLLSISASFDNLNGLTYVRGACALNGDSGGPLVMPNGDGTAVALGILVEAHQAQLPPDKCPHDIGQDDKYEDSYYEPIDRILADTNLSLRLN